MNKQMYLRVTRTRGKGTKWMEQQDSLRTYLGPGETLVQSSYEINTDCLSMSYLHDKSDVTIGVE